MTAVTTTAEPGTELDLGHPARSFVLAMAALAVALLALQWSGVVLPRVVTSGSGGGAPGMDVEWVRNDGPISVEITGLSWPTDNVRSAHVGLLPPGYDPGTSGRDHDSPDTAAEVKPVLQPFEPFTLDPGEERAIAIIAEPACDNWSLGSPVVEVRSPIGVHRSVDLFDRPMADHARC